MLKSSNKKNKWFSMVTQLLRWEHRFHSSILFFTALIMLNILAYWGLRNTGSLYDFVNIVQNYKEGDSVKFDFYSPKSFFLVDKEDENRKVDFELVELGIPPRYKIIESQRLAVLERLLFLREMIGNADDLDSIEQTFRENLAFLDVNSWREVNAIIERLLFLPLFPVKEKLVVAPDNSLTLVTGVTETRLSEDNRLSISDFPKIIDNFLTDENVATEKRTLIKAFALHYIKENVYYSQRETEERRAVLLLDISTKEKELISKGSLILKKGDIVTQDNLNVIKAISFWDILQERNLAPLFWGQLGLLFLACFNLKVYSKNNFKMPSLLYASLTVTLGNVLWLVGEQFNFNVDVSQIILSAFSLIIFYVYPRRMTVFILLFTSLQIFIFSLFKSDILIKYFLIFLITCSFSKQLATRLSIFYQAFLLCVLSQLGYLLLVQPEIILLDQIYQIVSGFSITTISIFILLPVFERLFRFATPFRLMELGNMSIPILKTLQEKAPGTYAHSLQVATLAEELGKLIGADPLLCRVAAYYHDIGKIDNAPYFIENQDDENPHDNLEPSLSAAIIKAHVKLGVDKANQLRLPKKIVQVIKEHHGDSLVRYFYQKALSSKKAVNEKDFRYQGQKPQSREAAVLLLADTVEAATRSLKEPSYQNLEDFIEKLLIDVYTSDQLDNVSLTFKDLAIAKKIFTERLISLHHVRVPYPDAKK